MAVQPSTEWQAAAPRVTGVSVATATGDLPTCGTCRVGGNRGVAIRTQAFEFGVGKVDAWAG